MPINYALPKPVAGTPRAGEEVSLMADVSDTVADIDTRITTEASDRATGDADTLAAANTYTDTALDNATFRVVGSGTTPETNAAAARPSGTAPVYWMMANGVTPSNAAAGDIIWNAA